MNPLPDQFPSTDLPLAPVPPTLRNIATTFFYIGLTSFGGMWGAMQTLEDELVTRKRWLTQEEQQSLMVAAVMIPAPKFLAFGSMIGYRLGGFKGSIVSTTALIAPGALLVLGAVMLLNRDSIGPALEPLQRAVGISVVGLLFGNAYQQLRNAKVTRTQRSIGVGLALAVFGAAVVGVPLLVAAGVGFGVGALLIRKNPTSKGKQT